MSHKLKVSIPQDKAMLTRTEVNRWRELIDCYNHLIRKTPNRLIWGETPAWMQTGVRLDREGVSVQALDNGPTFVHSASRVYPLRDISEAQCIYNAFQRRRDESLEYAVIAERLKEMYEHFFTNLLEREKIPRPHAERDECPDCFNILQEVVVEQPWSIEGEGRLRGRKGLMSGFVNGSWDMKGGSRTPRKQRYCRRCGYTEAAIKQKGDQHELA